MTLSIKTNLLVTWVIGFLIAITFATPALGCSCGPRRLDDELYSRLEMIIVGEIIETKKNRWFRENDTLALKIKVDKAWKQKAAPIISLPLLDWKDYCGDLEIAFGKKYFLTAIKIRQRIAVLGDCGASRLLEFAADDLKYLSKKHAWSYITPTDSLRPHASSQTPNRTTQRRAVGPQAAPLPDGVTAKDVRFYSEGVECHGKIFTPKGFSAESKAPAVALAPDWGETAASIEKYAAHFASRGMVAMVIDYRGWGRSGGFLQTVDEVKTDDRLRFSQLTAKVRIRRKRFIPKEQILDIRNALYYLQGEPGVDRARIGVWGAGMAGGHIIVIAATDARIKAAVAQTPIIEGKDAPRKAYAPKGELLLAEQKRARAGYLPVTRSSTDVETRLALAQYHPFWYVEQIPQKTAVMFVIAEKDARLNNEAHAIAASKLLKGPTDVARVPRVTHMQIGFGAAFNTAATTAAEWFLKYL